MEEARGKKRRAHSLCEESALSSTLKSSASDAFTALTHTTTKGSPMASPAAPTDQAMAYLQGLSLQSPVSGPTYLRTIPASAESPVSRVGSQSNRSSFLRYNAASPMSFAAGMSPGNASLMTKSPSLSPRRAPCTVLFGQTAHGATDAARASTSPEASKRPPLHQSGMSHLMQSLDDTTAKGTLTMDMLAKEPPLSTIHFHGAGQLLTSPGSHDSRLTDCAMTYMGHSSNLHSTTPCSKHSRSFELDSPSRRSVILSPSHQTPLPKLTLTPRSVESQRHRSAELPIFPMDLDTDTTVHSQSSSMRGLETPPSILRQESPRRGSFFPLPDWNEPTHSELLLQDTLYERSTSTDALEMYNVSTAAPPHGSRDNDSLSASDDEDDFFLAAPSVIHEEKRAFSHKQRKIELFPSEMPPRRLSSGHSLRSGLASNTSLLGMDFVTSSSNLQNMDRLNSKVFSQASFDELSNHYQSRADCNDPERDDESPAASIGLAFDSNPTVDMDHYQDGRRDLRTPPVNRAQPASPPPLLHGSNHHAFECDDHRLYVN
ncbi:hypothetical protein MPSEU_000740400 [Mayamaea pseudoterrestris]|nr:hypothetical protein MPSEU_000740400 [Mayamaea pseudoterrestris]